MITVLDKNTMQKSDLKTIESGVKSITLMKNASNFIFENIDKKLDTAIVCGVGNNGGDGFSLAETMIENSLKVNIYIVEKPKTESSLYYFEKLKKLNANIFYIENVEKFTEPQIIDCVFGIGLTREPIGLFKKAIDLINNSNAKIISADIPSGLNADNGIAFLSTVKAHTTTTFGAIKPGHLLADGKDFTGDLKVSDIGIIPENPKYYIYEEKDFKKYFLPLKQNLHKYNNGKVTIIGGSSNFVGAVTLSNMGVSALRVGSGLTNIAVPKFLAKNLRDKIINSTLSVLDCHNKFSIYNEENFENAIKKSKAVAIGMGMGQNPDLTKMLKHLLNKDISLLIDADGLNQLATDINLLNCKKANVILTPHIKEFSRLINKNVNDILQNPIKYAKDFAIKYDVTILLKGATTIITDGKNVAISPYGCSAMAKGGSGDILSGIIAGLLARDINCFKSGVIGAFIHGKAGEFAKFDLTDYSVIASDIPNYIPKVIKSIQNEKA